MDMMGVGVNRAVCSVYGIVCEWVLHVYYLRRLFTVNADRFMLALWI